MKVKVNKNRQVFKGSLSVGISNENNYEVLEFTFPQELDNYIKYIEIQAENEEGKLEYVDRIQDNKFTLTNRLTKYRELNMEISCRDLNRTVFKSEIFTVTTGEALNILEDLVEQQEDLFERVERELQEVYQGMEEFKTEIVEDANSRFNTNVTEKTQGFNTNAESKTNAFNSNYDEKLGTFNTNATSKLEQYNNNDTAKTEAYNTNATEKLSTYNQNATSKVAEYNSNAESKLNAYNTNATQKLAEYDSRVAELHEDLDETQAKVDQYNTNIDNKYTQYNTNAEQKLSAYNQNATTKTNSYNTNAQTKLDTFNTNATNKTNTYNTNATEKLTAYNTNATEKIDEYNENASELMTSVETLEQKHDTEVAGLEAEITSLENQVKDLQEKEAMVDDLIPAGNESGDNITLNDSARYYFKKFEVGGKSIQDGEPTPENEVAIQNVTGDVEVKVENRNLAVINDGTFRNTQLIKAIPVKQGENITAILNFNSNYSDTLNVRIYENSDLSNLLQTIGNVAQKNTDKIVSGISNFDGYMGITTDYGYTTITTNKLFVAKGQYTLENYVPHEEQTVTFPLNEGQLLHETDTIEDKIVQRRKTVIFDGSNDEGWYLQNNTFRCPLANAKYNGKVLSNYFIDRNTDNTGDYIWIFLDGYVLVKFPSMSTVEEFTTWLSTHNLTVEYELVEPIEIPFTEAQRTAKAQIDKLISYKGTTHITSNANLDVTYRKDPSIRDSKIDELEARLSLLEE